MLKQLVSTTLGAGAGESPTVIDIGDLIDVRDLPPEAAPELDETKERVRDLAPEAVARFERVEQLLNVALDGCTAAQREMLLAKHASVRDLMDQIVAALHDEGPVA